MRQTDLAVKYTSWAIAFILPDTPLAGAQLLADKLRKAGAEVRPPWILRRGDAERECGGSCGATGLSTARTS